MYSHEGEKFTGLVPYEDMHPGSTYIKPGTINVKDKKWFNPFTWKTT
jgi:hypothetical protein